MTHKLVEALSNLREGEVLAEIKELKERNVPLVEMIQLLQEGMSIVGSRFEAGEYYLSELILSSDIFKQAIDLLGERFEDQSLSKYGLWQVDEAELMKPEDYDRILVEGWPAFFRSYIQERIGGGV